ncbi:hypothetical protein MKX01_036858 [Papaver californicum]|nr:hypothetical protein MKX01_036858 [Papaver californicum]
MSALTQLLPPMAARSTTSTVCDHSNSPWAGPGQEKLGSKILPLTVDAHGNVAFDAIVRQHENASKIVYSSHRDLVPKVLKDGGGDHEPDKSDEEYQKKIEETTQNTKAALEKIVNARLSAAQPKNVVASQTSYAKLIKYKPSKQSTSFNSGAKERLVSLTAKPVDPLESPKFKHKKVPKASGSPPVQVMHSPPRPLTVEDHKDCKIPPCISNWKNSKGYTIPLDKHLTADGRCLEEIKINDNFAKLVEVLDIVKDKSRELVAMRSKVQQEMLLKEKEKKEQKLRALAQKDRSERTSGGAPPSSVPIPTSDRIMSEAQAGEDTEERLKREKIREERKRERERERRLEAKDEAMGIGENKF